jgi:hypothetical protein
LTARGGGLFRKARSRSKREESKGKRDERTATNRFHDVLVKKSSLLVPF